MSTERRWFCCGALLFLAYMQAPVAMAAADSCSSVPVFSQTTDLLKKKRYEEAAKSLETLRNCPQLTPLETFEMGWLYGRARQFRTALSIFERVSPGIPDRLTHGYAIALSRFELADYRGAIKTLEEFRREGSLDAKSSNLLAVSYSKLALYSEAYSVLQQQLGKDPSEIDTYLNLVTVCAEGGDYISAARFASQGVAKFPDSIEVLLVRGAADSLLGLSEQAIQDFSNAVRLAPERADARFFLALGDYNQGRYPDALAVLKQANQDGLQDSDLHYLAAETLLKTDASNRDPVIAELDLALRLNLKSVAARTLRGRMLLEKGEPAKALEDLEVANREDPAARSTIYNLARVYRALGKNEQAASLFHKLRTEDQGDILKEMGTRRLDETLAEKGVAR